MIAAAATCLVAIAAACSSATPAPSPVPMAIGPAPSHGASLSSRSSPLPVVPTPPPITRPPIVDWPLTWSEQRARLTLEYRRRHQSPQSEDLIIAPRVIVVHYTGGGSARATKAAFDHLTMEPGRRLLASAGKVNVSSHFLIDRDGTIYQLQPETRFARHCIGLNHIAIGIENVGDEQRWLLTEAQVAANAALVRDLASRFPITHLLGHHEVMSFRSHPYFLELDPQYRNSKSDPGPRFLSRVRREVADLGLRGLDAPESLPKR